MADSADQKSALLVSMPAVRNKKLDVKTEKKATGQMSHHLWAIDEGVDDMTSYPDVVGRALTAKVPASKCRFLVSVWQTVRQVHGSHMPMAH